MRVFQLLTSSGALAWATIFTTVFVLSATSAWAGTPYVDGISDQSIPNWDYKFSGSYFAGFFESDWINPAPHIQYARYIVQWNAMNGAGEAEVHYREQFEAWLNDISSMGLTPDVGLTSYNGEYPSPAAVREPAGDNSWVYYNGARNYLCYWDYLQSKWSNSCLTGETIAPGTSPTVVREAGTENQWIYYTGSTGNLCTWDYLKATWNNGCLVGEDVAAGTSPAVLREPAGDNSWVYYTGAKMYLCRWAYVNAAWGNGCLVGEKMQ